MSELRERLRALGIQLGASIAASAAPRPRRPTQRFPGKPSQSTGPRCTPCGANAMVKAAGSWGRPR